MEPERYTEVFEAWSKKSRYQEKVVDFLTEYFRKHPSEAKRIHNVLSVGPGNS